MEGVHVTTKQNALSIFYDITAMKGSAILISMIKCQHSCHGPRTGREREKKTN
jgi:hypothetical protein